MTHSRGFGIFGPSNLPPFKGEEPLKYLPGSAERAALKHALSKMYTECPEIPCVVNGEEIKTGQIKTQSLLNFSFFITKFNYFFILCFVSF